MNTENQDPDSAAPSKSEVRIHVDRRAVNSPDPTTGRDLYHLGRLPPDHLLYREVEGNYEDLLISNDAEQVSIHQDERFYSTEGHAKGYAVIVNGRPKKVHRSKLTFMQVVALAFDPIPNGPNWVFTITYRHGPSGNLQGTLIDGESVRIKNGMIFNVTATDKS
ncbi:MAG: multiubiquitin domain-containing protein [Phycisphaerae bacterium]|nr:multiubiquitin domain-containing protein [Phycisphaerae bacterium]